MSKYNLLNAKGTITVSNSVPTDLAGAKIPGISFSNRSVVLVLATFCCFLWGSSYPAIKNGYALLAIESSDIASQILFAGSRFVIAGLCLLAFALALRRRVVSLSPSSFRKMFVLGLTQTSIQYVFFYIGLAHASGVKSSIMNATGVFFSVALAHVIYSSDKLNSRKTIGCIIGFAGVVVVNLGGGTSLSFDFSLLGEGFVIIAAFVLAAASIYGKQISQSIDPLVMTGWQLLFGGALLTITGLLFNGQLAQLDIRSGALLLYLALLSSLAFSIWSFLLKHNPVGLIAAFNFLVPVFGVTLSAIFLGESLLRWSNLAALFLVSGGIWLVARPARA